MSLRDIEADSIRSFVQDCADQGLLSGRVLDFGCGKMPYREIVEKAGGDYVPYDRMHFPGSTAGMDLGSDREHGPFDAILCTQVIQYHPFPLLFLRSLPEFDVLLLTGPTNWPVVEGDDLGRLTASGADRLLKEAGFTDVDVRYRAWVQFEHESWPLGWQAVAKG